MPLSSKTKHESEIKQIVAEERQHSSTMPSYPGLERWILLEKMGDGAFSNVYRAKDSTGKYDEVAIKVVRKFEMNPKQVCMHSYVVFLLFFSFFFFFLPSLLEYFLANIDFIETKYSQRSHYHAPTQSSEYRQTS